MKVAAAATAAARQHQQQTAQETAIRTGQLHRKLKTSPAKDVSLAAAAAAAAAAVATAESSNHIGHTGQRH